MAEFLSEDALGAKIREVVKGKNLRCAVAFWGHGAVQDLFKSDTLKRNDVKIVCDLSMGGTNPKTLRALGAPENNDVKHFNGLRAKVYISDYGAVIGSANASNNGIGFMAGDARLTEAGVYFEFNDQSWQKSSEWSNAIFLDERAQKIDSSALNTARLAWDLRPSSGSCRGGQQKRGILEYDPEIHGLVYVLWYYDGGENVQLSEAAVKSVDANRNENSHHISPYDIDLRGSWVCCFRLKNIGFAHGLTNPIFFFANALIEDAVFGDLGYEDLLAESPGNIRPNEPFNLNDATLVTTFRNVMNNPQTDYGRLRGEADGTPWLAHDYVELMHQFWRDVQTEYRRLQVFH